MILTGMSFWRISSRASISGWVAVTSLSRYRADHQQVVRVDIADQALDQLERCGVGPLEIIEEQDQRVLGLGEDADKVLERQVEAILRFGRAKRGDGRLLAEKQLEIGQDIGDHRAVRRRARR